MPDASPAPHTTQHDPLGILAATARVMQGARAVRIDEAAIARMADGFVTQEVTIPPWDASLHYRGHRDSRDAEGSARTAGWVFALDALNFCFWSQGDDPNHRWKVEWQGTIHDGYNALAAALSRAVEDGYPLWDASWLATLDEPTLRTILRPIPGTPEIPLFPARLHHLRELGTALLAVPGDDATPPVVRLLTKASGSAIALVQEVVSRMPSFDDTAIWHDPATGEVLRIPFFKRAQILVADLAGSLEGHPLGTFRDLDALTAFADYKVPQVLRRLGILAYADTLAERIHRRDLIAAGSPEEIEIRAATIQACERIRHALHGRGRDVSAFEIDWLLWHAGQSLPSGTEPYHRTVTVFY
ncbi:MAG: queuosine salvage family protein [Thermomicrobiales bacterium]